MANDGGGHDTYNLSNYATNLKINLNPGAWTTTSPTQLANLSGDGIHLAQGNIANALEVVKGIKGDEAKKLIDDFFKKIRE